VIREQFVPLLKDEHTQLPKSSMERYACHPREMRAGMIDADILLLSQRAVGKRTGWGIATKHTILNRRSLAGITQH